MLRDPSKFFKGVRTSRLLGRLDQGEVDGCNAILEACSKASWPISWVAYALATTFHETSGTMQPIKEYGGTAYFTRMYDINGRRPHVARVLGNTKPGDGAKFAGRGYVQLTGRTNYARAEKLLAAPLLSNPDLAMRHNYAATIMITGMQDGWFTGRKLADDLPTCGYGTYDQFVRSRDIINGRDKQHDIAEEAIEFQRALIAGGWNK